MRILHVYKDFHPVVGGIENHIRHLATLQADEGHDVTVLVCNRGPETVVEWHDGIRIIKSGRLLTAASMPLSVHQVLALRRQATHVLHVHSPYPLGEVSSWLIARAGATVITYHSDVVRQRCLLRLYAPMLRRVLEAADTIIATSPRYVESSPWLRPLRDRCRVVPLGIDPTRFAPGWEKEAHAASVRRLHSDPGASGTSVLFVGRLRYYKGLAVLLRAMARVHEGRLFVVGDGPMRRKWQQLASELGLAARVRFVGEVPDTSLSAYYAAADLFVLPSDSRAEAFGTVLLEAMAARLPVISTELGTGTSWINQDGRTGLVVPARDESALAAAISELLRDPARRVRMGRAGRKRVLSEFDLPTMARRVLDVYEDALRLRRVSGTRSAALASRSG